MFLEERLLKTSFWAEHSVRHHWDSSDTLETSEKHKTSFTLITDCEKYLRRYESSLWIIFQWKLTVFQILRLWDLREEFVEGFVVALEALLKRTEGDRV